uniref:Craniofacial development protein 2 n=1 Tax=Cacopsylla melanoneura TaxID=428564 RepID=A0A8D9E6N4_9HEMI
MNKKSKALNFATWNVRTLLDSTRLSSITLQRRTAVIAHELKQYNIDIVALQETHLVGQGQLEESSAGYTYLWSGAKDAAQNFYGVAICARTELVQKGIVSEPSCINDRIMSVQVHGATSQTTFICCYAPTLVDDVIVIETFYEELRSVISRIPKTHNVILAGDFNARVGALSSNWRGVIGPHGIGRQNENGLRLLQLCVQEDLYIANTMFQQKDLYKTSWRHPRSKCWHQIDFIIVRRRNRGSILRCRSMRGPNCDTDHLLVRATIHFTKKRFQRNSQTRPKLFNISKLKDSSVRRTFEESIQALYHSEDQHDNRDAEIQWTRVKTSILQSAAAVLGKKPATRWDWFDDSDVEIQEILKKKRRAHLAYIENPTRIHKSEYSRVRGLCQRQIRALKEKWWAEKVKEMQHYMNINDTHNLHRCIKNIAGPVKKALNIVESQDGEHLKTKEEIASRWKQHFCGVLNQDTVVNIDSIQVPIRTTPESTPRDDPPTEAEVRTAIRQLKNHKCPGSDSITAELLKGGEDTVVNMMVTLLKKVWEEKHIPKDWTDAIVVPLHKKGNKAKCDNYRGISLLSVPGKVLSKVLCNRLSPFLETCFSDSQCGFRTERSTVDMIFATRQLVEKTLEQNTELCMAFIDIRKAFDSVNRRALFNILEQLHCPPNAITILRKLHENTHAAVRVDGEEGPSFEVRTGVRQGCVLAPLLFLVYIQIIVAILRLQHHEGVEIIYRADSDMFSRRGLKSQTKVSCSKMAELMFADDCAVVEKTPQALQAAVNIFSQAANSLGLKVNEDKTEVMFVNIQKRLCPFY